MQTYPLETMPSEWIHGGISVSAPIAGYDNSYGLDSMNSNWMPEELSSYTDETDDSNVAISTTFLPNSPRILPFSPDMVLVTSDSVMFYVESKILLRTSDNHFDSLVVPSELSERNSSRNEYLACFPIQELASTLNIILHSVYKLSADQYKHSFDEFSLAVDSLTKYGMKPSIYIIPSNPLSKSLLAFAPLCGMELYALASMHCLEDVAVQTSAHLLTYFLPDLSEAMTARIRPTYLRRLFMLHDDRVRTLRQMLRPPLRPHAPEYGCGFPDQKPLWTAWTLATAGIAWDATPYMSGSSLAEALLPLADHLECKTCRRNLRERVHQLVTDWSLTKRTI